MSNQYLFKWYRRALFSKRNNIYNLYNHSIFFIPSKDMNN